MTVVVSAEFRTTKGRRIEMAMAMDKNTSFDQIKRTIERKFNEEYGAEYGRCEFSTMEVNAASCLVSVLKTEGGD